VAAFVDKADGKVGCGEALDQFDDIFMFEFS